MSKVELQYKLAEDFHATVSRIQSLPSGLAISDVALMPDGRKGKVAATGTYLWARWEEIKRFINNKMNQAYFLCTVKGEPPSGTQWQEVMCNIRKKLWAVKEQAKVAKNTSKLRTKLDKLLKSEASQEEKAIQSREIRNAIDKEKTVPWDESKGFYPKEWLAWLVHGIPSGKYCSPMLFVQDPQSKSNENSLASKGRKQSRTMESLQVTVHIITNSPHIQ
jgi:hypothetical protein